MTELSHRIKDEIPEAYLDLAREHLRDFNNLQEQGTTFDQFLSSRGITSRAVQEDLEQQSREEAEECLALDALFKLLWHGNHRRGHRKGIQRNQQSGGHA